jgi:hypothetical protein
MATITQDILNQVFREYLKTLPVSEDVDKDARSASLLPRFEQQVNQLAAEFKGAAPVSVVRPSRSFYTRRNHRTPLSFGFRRTARRQRSWWLPRSRDLNPPVHVESNVTA